MLSATNHDDDPFDAIFESFVTVVEPILADVRVFPGEHRCTVREQQSRRCRPQGGHIRDCSDSLFSRCHELSSK